MLHLGKLIWQSVGFCCCRERLWQHSECLQTSQLGSEALLFDEQTSKVKELFEELERGKKLWKVK